jgi:hypothetical protein
MNDKTASEALKIRDEWIETVKNVKRDYERYGHKQWSLKTIYPVKIDYWNEILGIVNVFVENREKPYILCKGGGAFCQSFETQINYLKRSLSLPVSVNIINSTKYDFITVHIPSNV